MQNGFFFVESKWILGHPGVDGKRRQDLAPCVLAIHHQVTFLLGASTKKIRVGGGNHSLVGDTDALSTEGYQVQSCDELFVE